VIDIAECPKILVQPEWTDLHVKSEDATYFNWFLLFGQVAHRYTSMFPLSIHEMFSRVMHSRTLQHSILAISSAGADKALQRPATRALMYKQSALTSLQESLSTKNITDEVAMSIFLILFMDCFDGKEVSAAHLNGLFLVMKHLHPEFTNQDSWKSISPLLMLIMRISISLDNITSSVNQRVPILPLLSFDRLGLHRIWASSLSRSVRDVDCALASFALDDMFHRANHWLREAEQTSKTPEFINNPEYREEFSALYVSRLKILREEHALWLQQPYCALALQLEQNAQIHAIDHMPRFLDYPPLVIYDRAFVVLLNEWRIIRLIFTLIPLPPTHLTPRTKSEICHAIEICRTHVALALDPHSKDYVSEFFAILLAGRTFAGGANYKREFKWAYDRINLLCDMKHPILSEFQSFVDSVRGVGFAKTIRHEWEIPDDDWEARRFKMEGRLFLDQPIFCGEV
jgi:Fungal specific transcription factor domain